MDDKITGKMILSECATLAKHIGLYLSDVFKDVWTDAKNFSPPKKRTKRRPESAYVKEVII